ncbi:hypothetical protein CDAR_582471 [Caerostris darwini]|uniref:Uncharacterized protein n=1 Tax=Caerostris darwini TaxID=1538125 RepID=A0AAV4RG51_9ARAC|nr:hypothetical protein CDAR_582471 [Caerostris darwini]
MHETITHFCFREIKIEFVIQKLPGELLLTLEAVQRLVVDKVSSKEMHASNESLIFSSSHSRVRTKSSHLLLTIDSFTFRDDVFENIFSKAHLAAFWKEEATKHRPLKRRPFQIVFINLPG